MVDTRSAFALVSITEVNTDAPTWPLAVGRSASDEVYYIDLRTLPPGTPSVPAVGELYWIERRTTLWSIACKYDEQIAGAAAGSSLTWKTLTVTAVNVTGKTFTADGMTISTNGRGMPVVGQIVRVTNVAGSWLYMGPTAADAWHNLSLSGSWAVFTVGRYRKDPAGVVHVTGVITDTVAFPGNPESVFTLPAGYRPTADHGVAVNMWQNGLGYRTTFGYLTAGGVFQLYDWPTGGTGTRFLYPHFSTTVDY